MSDASGESTPQANELQFDRAEYATATSAATCKACGQPMHDVYYDVNGQPFCPRCRELLNQALTGGSAVGRFVRATVYGSLAGLLGAAIYYGVRELTNINFGLISILVGLMIGKAVQKGCNGHGGWFYQALAMFLTYTAIVLTYIPSMLQAVAADAQKGAAANPGQQAQPAGGNAAAAPAANAPEEPTPSLAGFLFAVVFLLGFAYAIPILLGFQSPMGLVIIGIGLYEAWVINKRIGFAIGGPYKISAADPAGGLHVEPAG